MALRASKIMWPSWPSRERCGIALLRCHSSDNAMLCLLFKIPNCNKKRFSLLFIFSGISESCLQGALSEEFCEIIKNLRRLVAQFFKGFILELLRLELGVLSLERGLVWLQLFRLRPDRLYVKRRLLFRRPLNFIPGGRGGAKNELRQRFSR